MDTSIYDWSCYCDLLKMKGKGNGHAIFWDICDLFTIWIIEINVSCTYYCLNDN